MKFCVLLLGISYLAAADPRAAATATAPARTPVLLELFTSEGCSSCPPADALLTSLDRTQPVAGADLIVVSEHVDYWNKLGWVDQNSSRTFSDRQSAYAERLHADSVYTPQLLVDGTFPLVGSHQSQAEKSIGSALKTPKSMSSIQATGNNVHIHIDPIADKRPATVYLVLAVDHVSSQVTSGENAGRLLAHTAVAYSIRKIGSVGETPFEGELRANVKPQSRAIVFAQDEKTGHVVAASQTRVQ